jgi:hypothetical protein
MSNLLKRALKFTESYRQTLGDDIKILPGIDPGDTEQDDYGAIIKRSDQNAKTVRSYPIRFQPSAKELEESGLAFRVDAAFPVAHGELVRAGLKIENIEQAVEVDPTRAALIHQGVQYLIATIGRPHTINDKSLAYVFGCMHK